MEARRSPVARCARDPYFGRSLFWYNAIVGVGGSDKTDSLRTHQSNSTSLLSSALTMSLSSLSEPPDLSTSLNELFKQKSTPGGEGILEHKNTTIVI
jgi:hypothetical protein